MARPAGIAGLEEIVVTARRTEEKLQRTFLAATALVPATVPGFTVTAGAPSGGAFAISRPGGQVGDAAEFLKRPASKDLIGWARADQMLPDQ